MASREVNALVEGLRKMVLREFDMDRETARLQAGMLALNEEDFRALQVMVDEILGAADDARSTIEEHGWADSTARQHFRRVVNDAGLDREPVR